MTPRSSAAAVPAPAVRPRRRRVGGQPYPRRRRISGPARPAPNRPARLPSDRLAGRIGRNPAARVAPRTSFSLPDRLLDRLIRGRAWIGVVAFALIGIVAMQLWVVKLSVGIGRALEHAALLQRVNSALEVTDSASSSGERVERLASLRGMVAAPPGAVHFATIEGPLDVHLAAAALARPPQPQGTGAAEAPVRASGGEGTEAHPAASGEGAAATAPAGAGTSVTTSTPEAPPGG